jgi:hypothetical protein
MKRLYGKTQPKFNNNKNWQILPVIGVPHAKEFLVVLNYGNTTELLAVMCATFSLI